MSHFPSVHAWYPTKSVHAYLVVSALQVYGLEFGMHNIYPQACYMPHLSHHHFNHHNTHTVSSSFFLSYPDLFNLLIVGVCAWPHSITHTHTLGKTPLDEGSARRTELYLTAHNTHKRQTSMPPAGFEPAIPESGRPQTHVLDRLASLLRIPNFIISSKGFFF
jgi:hypothetical protein